MTSARLLRPAVAREAYQHRDLWEWDRRHDDLVGRDFALSYVAMLEDGIFED